MDVPLFKDLVLGEVYTNKRGEQMKVICRQGDTNYYLVEYPETGNLQYINATHVTRAYDKSKVFLFGVGYFKCKGAPINCFDKEGKMLYQCWSNMINRCYNKNSKMKTYKGVTVAEEWHDFANFYAWAKQQPYSADAHLQLDKDLFSPPDHKIYSPETCCFLPNQLNAQLVTLKHEDIFHPTRSPRMERICQHMASLLLAYEPYISKRVSDTLWPVCHANGYDREKIMLQEKCEKQEKRISSLEREVENLKKIKLNYEQNDIEGKWMKNLFALMPLQGFVQHNNKIYKLESGKDLCDLITKVKETTLHAPLPSAR